MWNRAPRLAEVSPRLAEVGRIQATRGERDRMLVRLEGGETLGNVIRLDSTYTRRLFANKCLCNDVILRHAALVRCLSRLVQYFYVVP